MPAKAKVTKEMIIDAAFEIARETGAENINARTVSQRLNCSTQPVMYHFSTISELKRAVYTKLDQYHTEYLMNIEKPQQGGMLGIGLNYIRFAVEEPHLFRFLFQSGFVMENSLPDMIDSSELLPVISALQGAVGMSIEETKKVLLTISMFAHGYASMIANNALHFDEEIIKAHLTQAYRGAVLAAQEEMK